MEAKRLVHPPGGDPRPTVVVWRQWERLERVRAAMVRRGILDKDAKAADVIKAMRREIPVDLFMD